MALLFIDGWDNTIHLEQRYTVAGDRFWHRTGGERSRVHLQIEPGLTAITPANVHITRVLPQPIRTAIVGLAFQVMNVNTSMLGSRWVPLVIFTEGAVVHCVVGFSRETSRLVMWSGSNANNVQVTGSTSIVLGSWYYLEVRVTCGLAGVGSLHVRLNGDDDIVAPGALTRSGGTGVFDGVRLGSMNNTAWGHADCRYDDFYICDLSGSRNNDFLGDCRVETLMPSAQGFYSQWSPNGAATNFGCVNEEIADGNATYVSASDVGSKDSYPLLVNFHDPNPTILGIQSAAVARKDDVGTRTLSPLVRSGGVDHEYPASALMDHFTAVSRVLEAVPGTESPWTTASLAATEFGFKVES